MNKEQANRIHTGKGFIAALDQSGGSTPKALQDYGIGADRYENQEQMFTVVHEMRTRMITSPSFNSHYILGAILFEGTMNRKIEGQFTADYLWEQKRIVPFLKVDQGLAEMNKGVQLMKPLHGLADLLKRAVDKNIFGTKMRSLIKEPHKEGIRELVAQQFEVGKQIWSSGLTPIIEPEVDITSENRMQSETILKEEILQQLARLDSNMFVILKLSIPVQANFYEEFIHHPRVLRVVALSGGYEQKEANAKLSINEGLIASFSRALSEGLSDQQNEEQFNATLASSVSAIYDASLT